MRDMGGRTLLHIEAESGYPWNVERQIEAGADIHARAGKDFLSFTPLHFAAEFGRAEAVALLLAAGADPRITDDGGKVPSWYARHKGHDAIAEILKAKEQELDLRDKHGVSKDALVFFGL
ncbi:ankyrin repeat domain-containing protein [Serratia nevei]|uniref:ankyrin repeat domain-containing protein n=1 Tax=Serratia nevei TaxID=2703794 RepID=UPI00254C3595|nr:ankyrin repeat domain-containing protein [Serratia nevei]MDK5165484.1 ankyrin repeat domain-containing protein [Serratia nevei]